MPFDGIAVPDNVVTVDFGGAPERRRRSTGLARSDDSLLAASVHVTRQFLVGFLIQGKHFIRRSGAVRCH